MGAKTHDYMTYTSKELGFAIPLPSDWQVYSDNTYDGTCDGSFELRSQRVSAKNVGDIVPVPPYSVEDVINLEHEIEKQREAQEARRQNLSKMESGLFNAAPAHNDKDDLNLDISTYNLSQPMTALDIFELNRMGLSEFVPWGTRPKREIDIDGLKGVKYYFIYDAEALDSWWHIKSPSEIIKMRRLTDGTVVEGDGKDTMLYFFNVYLADACDGWILSCSCLARAFKQHKPMFVHMISNFKRTNRP